VKQKVVLKDQKKTQKTNKQFNNISIVDENKQKKINVKVIEK
jgi:hypothetical protein